MRAALANHDAICCGAALGVLCIELKKCLLFCCAFVLRLCAGAILWAVESAMGREDVFVEFADTVAAGVRTPNK